MARLLRGRYELFAIRGFARRALVLAFFAGCVATPLARAEVVEEIVAWVNGEIITRSELEDEEKQMVAEVYRAYSGADLDQKVAELKAGLLKDMIERKILLDRAKSLFQDLNQIKEFYYKGFKEDQKISDDAEFAKMIAEEGMTVEQFKTRLLETYAPKEVLRVEVRDRISIGDAEVEAFYKQHPEMFLIPAKLSVSEIVLKAPTAEAREQREADAKAVVAELRAGADFAETARRVSDAGTKDAGGVLGEIVKGDLAADLEEAAMALPAGGISEPIPMSYGFHILKMDSRVDEQTEKLDDVREKIRTFLTDRKFNEERLKYLDRIRAEAQWCVKAKFRDRVTAELQSTMHCRES
jgi:peptidyl-prolyl cis-trans isomerase SurA